MRLGLESVQLRVCFPLSPCCVAAFRIGGAKLLMPLLRGSREGFGDWVLDPVYVSKASPTPLPRLVRLKPSLPSPYSHLFYHPAPASPSQHRSRNWFGEECVCLCTVRHNSWVILTVLYGAFAAFLGQHKRLVQGHRASSIELYLIFLYMCCWFQFWEYYICISSEGLFPCTSTHAKEWK